MKGVGGGGSMRCDCFCVRLLIGKLKADICWVKMPLLD